MTYKDPVSNDEHYDYSRYNKGQYLVVIERGAQPKALLGKVHVIDNSSMRDWLNENIENIVGDMFQYDETLEYYIVKKLGIKLENAFWIETDNLIYDNMGINLSNLFRLLKEKEEK